MRAGFPDGNGHTSSDGQLEFKRLWYHCGSGGHEYGVERCFVCRALGSIGVTNVDIVATGLLEISGGQYSPLINAFDRSNLARDLG